MICQMGVNTKFVILGGSVTRCKKKVGDVTIDDVCVTA